MPAITYRLTSVCAGGNHYTLELSGAVTRTLVVEREDLARPRRALLTRSAR